MLLLNQALLDVYNQEDLDFSRPLNDTNFDNSIYTKWLKDSLAKRFIFQQLYGDLLTANNKSVLDVGGGITPYTILLKNNCKSYDLCEILSHDREYKFIVEKYLFEDDWSKMVAKDYDIVVANDIFPNVDQRLNHFINKFLPYCMELRLSLTFYNNERYYITKRIDADEHLVFSAYSGELVKCVLEKYKDRLLNFSDSSFEIFDASSESSVYPNKRHVAIVRLKGDRDA